MGMVAYCFLEVLLPPPPPMRRPSAVADSEVAEAMVRNGSFSAIPLPGGAHGEAGAAVGSASTPNAGVVAGVGAATGVVKSSSMISAQGGGGRESASSTLAAKRVKVRSRPSTPPSPPRCAHCPQRPAALRWPAHLSGRMHRGGRGPRLRDAR